MMHEIDGTGALPLVLVVAIPLAMVLALAQEMAFQMAKAPAMGVGCIRGDQETK